MKTIDILIVEDELLIAENLAMKLEKFKYNVTDIVSSGKAAIKKVNSQNPSLILMDIAIKGDMDGVQTAEAIRLTHDIPIIFLTAYADDKTLERASKTGCYGYILKPFKDRELHAAIKVALNKHKEENIIRQSLQARIEHHASKCSLANIDQLTKLPNHLSLENLFEYILSESDNDLTNQSTEINQQSSPSQINQELLAVFYFEIDRFKRIVNSLSDTNRDLLIIDITECLTNSLVEYDNATATIKLQNSEFAILVAGIKQQTEAKNIADKILNQFRKSFIINDLEFFLTASIGIAFYPFNDTEVEQLLKQARQAMQYAQEQGGDKCKVYSTSLQLVTSVANENLSIETGLHYALERQELELYYQPKIELKTGKIVGAEALVRWNHPQMGLMMPDHFIPIAEQSSLIESIGEWVLANACKKNTSLAPIRI